MYNMINVINTAICYIWKFLSKSYESQRKNIFFLHLFFYDGCSLNLR